MACDAAPVSIREHPGTRPDVARVPEVWWSGHCQREAAQHAHRQSLLHLEVEAVRSEQRGCAVQGRKMSKSLGNVVDPLDVSSEYGCDALRYTLATGSTPGQDVNLSLDRVTSSRNLTNKIWNAAKFVQFGTQDLSQEEYQALGRASFCDQAEVDRLPLPERWIVSRLHECASQRTPLRCMLPGHVVHHVGMTIAVHECAVLGFHTALGLLAGATSPACGTVPGWDAGRARGACRASRPCAAG